MMYVKIKYGQALDEGVEHLVACEQVQYSTVTAEHQSEIERTVNKDKDALHVTCFPGGQEFSVPQIPGNGVFVMNGTGKTIDHIRWE